MNAGTTPQGYRGLGLADQLRDCTQRGIVLIDFKTARARLSVEACRLLEIPTADVSLALLPATLAEFARGVSVGATSAGADGSELKLGADRSLSVKSLRWEAQPGESLVILSLEDPRCLARLEERLEHLDRLSSAGTLAATMAHEIKNALVACRTFIDLLLEKNAEAELAEVVRREMGRIDAMVGRMLKFAGSPAAPRFQPVNVHTVLQHSLQLIEPQLCGKQIILERDFAAAGDRAQGDECELEQAFVNLFLNALEAAGANGTVAVSTCLSRGSGKSPDRIQITIRDSGPGIPLENLPHIFEPFFTTKSGGTGLGLAVTQRVVRDHGGTITAESEPGRGAKFTILLPLLHGVRSPVEKDLSDPVSGFARAGASRRAAAG